MVPVRNSSLEEVSERLKAARAAQEQWRRYSLTQRVKALRAWWDKLAASRADLIEVIRQETGKPISEIESMEIDGAGLLLKHFTRNAHRVLQDQAAARPWVTFNKRAYVRYVPRGVIGIITPWNLPFLIPFGDSVPALLAGNAVLLKPSEWTTKTALFLEDRFRNSGLFPEGLLQVAAGDGEVGSAVASAADMILFTGSARSGRKVALAAAHRLVPAVLELGGKHPMLVARDAAIARAAKAAAWGRFANSGQLCVGVERVYVEEEVYPAFVEALIREVAALRQSLKPDPEVDLGRLIVPAQLETAIRHIQDARQKGARVIGGEVLDRDNLLISPALVLDAKQDMLVMQEETFGPVLPVMKVRRIDEAVRLANEGPYGLSASVWTRDLSRGEELTALIQAGLVSVNDVSTHFLIASLPFGGVKESGSGRRHSDEGLRMFCQPQSVIVHEWPAEQPDPWWFPYSKAKSRLIRLLTQLT